MGSIVAFDLGVSRPVVRCDVDLEVGRIVNLHAVQDADERLGEGDVADVQDGDGRQDDLLEQVGPRLSSLDLDGQPDHAEDADDSQGDADVDDDAGDRTIHRGTVRDDAVH